MRRFVGTVLLTCALAAQSLHAYAQGKKESSQAGAAEDAAKSGSASQTAPAAAPQQKPAAPSSPPAARAKNPVKVLPRTAVPATPQIGIGVATPSPPRGTRGRTYDPARRGDGMGVYVPMQLPPTAPAEPAPPAYGNVPAPAPPAPASIAIPAYDAGDATPAARPPDATPLAPASGDANAPQPAPGAPQLAGRFSGMPGQTLHTWEFRPDGTFEHAWTAGDPAAVDAHLEAGTYSVMGPYLNLVVWGRAGTRSAPAARGTQQVRRHRIGMRPGAGNGIILDGTMLRPRNDE